ncbi:anti-sigma factor [Phycisphaerales bacterium AB-hyl4]|uniref:Anti-sigma factor n=1 Tax=Natronomicrosphaera hydrolytica TaxID=3242702 RepID=A0ABV4U782_9BACT
MSCEYSSERLMLYLAGTLEADEECAIEAHLRDGCMACEARLAEGRRVLDEIPLALEPRAVRPAVRDRLMARIAEHADEDAPAAMRLTRSEAASAASAATSVGSAGAQPTGAASGLRRWSWIGGIGACAAAAALAAGVTFTTMDRQVQRQAEAVALWQVEVEQYQKRLADSDTRTVRLEQLADMAAELYATFRSSPVEMVRMKGIDEYQDTSARLIWDRSRNVGHFVGPEGFRPPDGRRLKLWLVSGDEEALSAGTFALDESGWARFDIGMPEVDFSTFDAAYISYDDGDDADGVSKPRRVLLSGNF